jgi:hypothetical protein
MNPDQVFVIVMGAMAAWTIARIFRGPIGEALARRIARSPATAEPGGADEAVAELQVRVAELEERLDFTERVLLQERPAGQLDRGGPK